MMDDNTSNTPKKIWYFIGGFGLGAIVSYYYYSNTIISARGEINVAISDCSGEVIRTLYHFNKHDKCIHFKKSLVDVDIKIVFPNGSKEEYYGFTGSILSLKTASG